MPLRDHFRPPLDEITSWEGFHGGWPMVIVQQLRKQLPSGYVAEPRVHSGSQVEIDVATYETDVPNRPQTSSDAGGVATVTWAPSMPSLAIETTLPDYDAYEVRVYDVRRGRHLVAAVEIVSPANKDRPDHRNLFVAKCAGLLQRGVAVSIVDIVSVRRFNLYLELLTLLGHSDPSLGDPAPHLYAASIRWARRDERTFLEAWSHALGIGGPLPTLPLWLNEVHFVPLDLEQSYENTCHDLWIP